MRLTVVPVTDARSYMSNIPGQLQIEKMRGRFLTKFERIMTILGLDFKQLQLQFIFWVANSSRQMQPHIHTRGFDQAAGILAIR